MQKLFVAAATVVFLASTGSYSGSSAISESKQCINEICKIQKWNCIGVFVEQFFASRADV